MVPEIAWRLSPGQPQNMEFPFRDWSHYPRAFPFYLQVLATNFLKGKDHWIRRTTSHYSFSFIFAGKGEYRCQGQCQRVEAPCLMVNGPGVYRAYGPERPEDAWDELYFTYKPQARGALEQAGLLRLTPPIQPMLNPGTIWSLAEELASLTHAWPPEQQVDRVDRVCERMILEALAARPGVGSEENVIDKVVNQIRGFPQKPFDLKETARLHGMSEATFRRCWKAAVGESPRRFVEKLRMQEACRLLVETSLPINDVAHQLGFADELYFSRRFRSLMGLPPRSYRRKHLI